MLILDAPAHELDPAWIRWRRNLLTTGTGLASAAVRRHGTLRQTPREGAWSDHCPSSRYGGETMP